VYQDNVAFFNRVTGTTPLQVFGHLAAKNDRSQFIYFFLPLTGIIEEEVDVWIHSGLCHSVTTLVCPECSEIGCAT
jgi:filamentous hemagglutinin family protein